MILFSVFCVILGTLVLQGLTLPWLIRLLGIEADDSDALEQEARARLQAAEAALDRIDDLEREDWTRDETLERMRGLYRYRRNRFAARFDDDVDDGAIEDRSTLYGRMMFAVIDAQREAIEGMRRAGEISDEVMRSGRARPRPGGAAPRRSAGVTRARRGGGRRSRRWCAARSASGSR